MNKAPDVREDGFWADKIPCWVWRGCSREGVLQCGAYLDQSRACWEHEDTLTKKLLCMDSCFVCGVFRLYGHGGSTPHPRGRRSES